MPHVLACVTQEHDVRLVLLAALVYLLACLTAFGLVARGRGAAATGHRWLWIAAAAIVSGCGVWATHFVAMLAYRPGLPLSYDVGLTMLSVGIAVAVIGCGHAMAGAGWATLGRGVAGGGIAAMHYTGMSAMRVAAEVAYDPATVAMSVAIGVVPGACAFHVREHRPGLLGEACAAAVFALAMLGLHFTAMSSLTLAPEL
jgi:diguanylate cyclase